MTVWIAKEILSRDVLGHRAIVIQKLLQVIRWGEGRGGEGEGEEAREGGREEEDT